MEANPIQLQMQPEVKEQTCPYLVEGSINVPSLQETEHALLAWMHQCWEVVQGLDPL